MAGTPMVRPRAVSVGPQGAPIVAINPPLAGELESVKVPAAEERHPPTNAARSNERDAQLLDDGVGLRPHAAPPDERFRGLLDQHAHAIREAFGARVARGA